MNKLEEIAALYEDLDKKVASMGEGLFREFFKEIFELAPEIKAIHWRQYVPGFNDGDPCVFGFYDIDVCIDGLDKKPDSEWLYETAYDYMDDHESEVINVTAMNEDYPQFLNSANWYITSSEPELEWHWESGKGRWSTPSGIPENICQAISRVHTTIFNNKQACETVFGSNAEITVTPEKITVDDFECGW